MENRISYEKCFLVDNKMKTSCRFFALIFCSIFSWLFGLAKNALWLSISSEASATKTTVVARFYSH